MFKLVCHENIPGTQFHRGDVIHDAASIALIEEQSELAKHFTRVAGDTFPDPEPSSAPARPTIPPPSAAPAAAKAAD